MVDAETGCTTQINAGDLIINQGDDNSDKTGLYLSEASGDDGKCAMERDRFVCCALVG